MDAYMRAAVLVGRRRVLGRRSLFVVFLALLAGLVPFLFWEGPASAAGTLPDGFSQSRLVGGLNNPTAMAFAPDGRLFVAEKGGRLRVVKDGQLLAKPIFSVGADVTGERGLLGVAVDPNFSQNHYVYVHYTAKTPTTHNRVVRFTMSGDSYAPGSARSILELNKLGGAYHNGGAIHFGKDGKLYVAVGDNGTSSNAQNSTNLFGKMLRINKDGSIPTNNPLYRSASGKNRAIYARGFRNPYSFAVQPGTGRTFVNDVGQKTWEEVNDLSRGFNYGWPVYEGPESDSRFTSPLHAYGHGTGETTGCAITGGAFYNPGTATFPAEHVGDYFFADFCSGWIRSYDPATKTVSPFRSADPFAEKPVDLQVGNDGNLYVLALATGSVEKIQYTG